MMPGLLLDHEALREAETKDHVMCGDNDNERDKAKFRRTLSLSVSSAKEEENVVFENISLQSRLSVTMLKGETSNDDKQRKSKNLQIFELGGNRR